MSCQERFDKGYVTQFDMDLANDFLELELERFPELKMTSFYNAVDVGNIVFLVVGKGHIPKYKKELINYIKELYEIPSIKLVEKGSPKEMIQQLINPAKLLGVNQIYIPTGDSEFRVIISAEDKEKITVPLDILESASSIMIRGITKIDFN